MSWGFNGENTAILRLTLLCINKHLSRPHSILGRIPRPARSWCFIQTWNSDRRWSRKGVRSSQGGGETGGRDWSGARCYLKVSHVTVQASGKLEAYKPYNFILTVGTSLKKIVRTYICQGCIVVSNTWKEEKNLKKATKAYYWILQTRDY